MNVVYVLILLTAAGSTDGGVHGLSVEFSAQHECEEALRDLKAQHERAYRGRLLGGCYQKARP